MFKSTFFSCILLCLTLISACSENASDEQIKLPNNLLVEVEYLGKGVVKANFSAENAKFFKVNFGVPGESLIRVDGNNATKTYTTKGDFTVVVQAHAS